MDLQEQSYRYKEAIFNAIAEGDLRNALRLCRDFIRIDTNLDEKYRYKIISLEWRLENSINPTANISEIDINILFTELQQRMDEISIDIVGIESESRVEQSSISFSKFSKNPLKVFLSYSHADKEWKEELEDHLSGLKRGGEITIWHDGMIMPGDEWDGEIKKFLDKSDLILFLVSPSLMKSSYIWEEEIPQALDRQEKGECKVIPIFTRPIDIEGTIFHKLQGLPRDKEWLSKNDKDTGLYNVTLELRKIIKNWKR